jgi:GT2 family glycosyltransferase
MLASLLSQTVRPAEVIVVDSSKQPVESVTNEFSDLAIRYVRHSVPSAAAQRNAGIHACSTLTTLIGFADDDTTFEPLAFENMITFWERAQQDTQGAAFNLQNHPIRGSSFLKTSLLAHTLGLYSSKPGSVSLSGWQTMIGTLDKTQFVDWLPTTAVVFRRNVFERNLFDGLFESYSYLEDLDLSYTVSRSGRLAVVADAKFCHFPSTEGRVSARQFGRYEVRNRLYFVRKHHLSVPRCYLGLAIRFVMSICNCIARQDGVHFNRAIGNLEELLRVCFAH